MGSKHMKRLTVPRRWSIPKKTSTWAIVPRPGPHPKKDSLPLAVIVRDYLGLADTFKEAKKIITSRKVKVDGKVVTDPRRPIGFMDVISIEGINKHYRLLMDRRGKLIPVEIPEDNAGWKLCKIKRKMNIKGGLFQIGLHDGRSIILTKDEAKNLKCGDTIKISLPDQKILATYPLKEGSVALITGGRHAGVNRVIVRKEVVRSPMPNRVFLEGDINTIEDYVFVVGKSHPEIVLPEVGGNE